MFLLDIVAAGCLVWCFAVFLICAIGVSQIRWHYFSGPSSTIRHDQLRDQCLPYLTIIRPVKGIEPYLYECLAATFHQTYPRNRFQICFCISSRSDPAFPILEHLLANSSDYNVKILVEEEDPNLSGHNGRAGNLGPNPKIRNMSRAYREAQGDILWIVDCNVWVGPSVASRMVNLLCGFSSQTPQNALGRKYKFVHQLPLVVDISSSQFQTHQLPLSQSGGLLEEMFLSTAHAKFYTGINTIAIAPCIVGKSNMFRRSHLNALTSPSPQSPNKIAGIDTFSSNICEDHLIGDLLWKSPVPENIQDPVTREGTDPHSPFIYRKSRWGNHALLPPSPSNLAIQPTSHYPLVSYIDRRTRWLRVRKFTVTLATLVEPGTESLLCSAYGAFGLTTLPWCTHNLGIPQTWSAFFVIYLVSITLWACVDRYVYGILQSSDPSHLDEKPPFPINGKKRGWGRWILAWLGREVLAFPIWAWAVWGGVSVVWRGRRFWVGVDMRVHEIRVKEGARVQGRGKDGSNGNEHVGDGRFKDRMD